MAKTGTGKYAPVIEALRAQIGSGEVQPGDWLPSEAQLMNEYGVSRYSAREAVRRLASEGLIVVVDGKGSYVRARQRASHADVRAIHQTAQVRRGGKGGRTERSVYTDAESPRWTEAETPTTARVNANVDLALALGVPEHTPLFVYERLLDEGSAASGPARRMTHRLFLPMPTCVRVPALADDPWRSPDELYAALTDAGIDLAWTEHVQAAIPAPDDTASLHLTPGAAVLVTRRITSERTDPAGRALAMEETRRSAENTQLSYPLTPISPAGTADGH
ncbi:MAG TPA: GntR family transcriptional regulator [Actinophytocola sp.]|jgi:GntR family transcriptional regulator|nr:GntR family transcriptional regulator [Actinophytocola sp.]